MLTDQSVLARTRAFVRKLGSELESSTRKKIPTRTELGSGVLSTVSFGALLRRDDGRVIRLPLSQRSCRQQSLELHDLPGRLVWIASLTTPLSGLIRNGESPDGSSIRIALRSAWVAERSLKVLDILTPSFNSMN